MTPVLVFNVLQIVTRLLMANVNVKYVQMDMLLMLVKLLVYHVQQDYILLAVLLVLPVHQEAIPLLMEVQCVYLVVAVVNLTQLEQDV